MSEGRAPASITAPPLLTRAQKAANLLDRAADYIETNGWTRKRFKARFSDKVCAIGALITTGQDDDEATFEMARDAVTHYVFDDPNTFYEDSLLGHMVPVAPCVPSWNDALPRSRGKAQVIRTFRTVARQLRAS